MTRLPIPLEPIVEPPPSSVYRLIRAQTRAATPGTGAPTEPKRQRGWLKRPGKRYNVNLTLTGELRGAVMAVAEQEKSSLSAACRSLISLGIQRYEAIINEKILKIAKDALADD